MDMQHLQQKRKTFLPDSQADTGGKADRSLL